MTDALLVRAPVGAVYRTLTDLDGWSRWLPGCRSARLAAEDGADRHLLVLPVSLRSPGLRSPGRRGQRMTVGVRGWRHDAGVRWDVERPVRLAVEWWLEPRREGTVLHHVVHGGPLQDATAPGASTGRAGASRVRRYRRAVGLAMQTMKDHLERVDASVTGGVA